MRQTHIPEDKSGHTEAGQVGDESETHIDTPSRTQVRHTQAECKSNLVTCTLVHVHTCTPTRTHTHKERQHKSLLPSVIRRDRLAVDSGHVFHTCMHIHAFT